MTSSTPHLASGSSAKGVLWALAHLCRRRGSGPVLQTEATTTLPLPPTIAHRTTFLPFSPRAAYSYLLESLASYLLNLDTAHPSTMSTLSPRKSSSPGLTVRVGRERSSSIVKVEKVGEESQADVLDQGMYDNLNAEWVNRKGMPTAISWPSTPD